ncbi:3-dehydrosphinganine reductase [Phlyctochytrium planicorne]|nr:3-dehydrosphinganine reductase [Phlyctochytrium planicorne]
MSQIGNYSILFALAIPVLASIKVIVNYAIANSLLLKYSSLRSEVQDKHVIVTGGSKGLGKSIVMLLLRSGASVTVLARGADRDGEGKSSLDRVVEEGEKMLKRLKTGGGGSIRGFKTDAANYEGVIETLRQVYKEFGYPYWVVANAGGAWPGFVADQLNVHGKTEPNAFEAMMSQNYLTAVNITRAIMVLAKEQPLIASEDTSSSAESLKVLQKKGFEPKTWRISGLVDEQQVAVPARIVYVGSVLSAMSFLGYSAYAGSKYALRGLAESLRSEFKPLGCKVHLYLPANMDTPGHVIENETKPEITAKIEGTAATQSGDQAARSLLAGILYNRFFITNDLIGEIVRVVANGCAPRPNPVSEPTPHIQHNNMVAGRYPPISLVSHMKKFYSLQVLVGAVTLGLGGGAFLMQNVLRKDPTIVLVNKSENPFPWLKVDQGTNLKLYAVNQKFDKNVEKGFKA